MALDEATRKQFGGRFIDLSDHPPFVRLTAIRPIPGTGGGGKSVKWECRCSCPAGTIVIVDSGNLRSGNSKSCGCLHRERAAAYHRTHGHAGRHDRAPEYNSWAGMIDRCHNPNSTSRHNYGGRGIIVCERWRHSFENFYADMGPKPGRGYSIERKENSLGYGPDNCEWATRAVQNRNTRKNRMLTHDGKTQCLQDWANELGINGVTLMERLEKGWPPEQVFFPGRYRGGPRVGPGPRPVVQNLPAAG